MIVNAGATSISVDVFFADDTGAALTGKVAADFPACKWSSGTNTADTTITLTDLAAITTAHPNDNTAGGVKEREGGWYRLDVPNNAFTSAGRRVLTFAETTNKRILAPVIDVGPKVDVDTIKTQAITCSAGVTVGAFVGNATAAIVIDASGRVDVGKALGTAVTLDANNVLNVSTKYWAGTAITATSIPVATAAGAAGGLFIAGSNAATTISGLTTGAFSCTTFTASGAVAFQSTFAVTTSTSLGALSCTTLTASGAVAFQSTFAVTTSTALGAVSGSTLTLSGAVAFQSTLIVTGATTLTGAVTASNASNNIVGITVATNNDKTGYSLTVAPPTAAVIATAVWTDTTGSDFTTLTSPGKIIFAQLGGAFTTTSSSVFTVGALANAPTGGTAPTAAQIATAVWTDTTASDFTTASSIGKSLYTTGNAPGAASGLALVGSAMALTSGERNSVADALLDRADAIETGITLRLAVRYIGATAAGKLAGSQTVTEVFKGLDGVTTRVTSTVDSSGNRSAVVYS